MRAILILGLISKFIPILFVFISHFDSLIRLNKFKFTTRGKLILISSEHAPRTQKFAEYKVTIYCLLISILFVYSARKIHHL